MKRILLLSDSHGNQVNMETAFQRAKPDMVFFMGDGIKDAERLRLAHPGVLFEMVSGNCDWGEIGRNQKLFELEGYRILMCHGHYFGVKNSLLSMQLAGKEMGADIVLYGHTHRLFYDLYDGLAIFNPGSIGDPPYGIPASYGILILDKEKGILKMETGYIE